MVRRCSSKQAGSLELKEAPKMYKFYVAFGIASPRDQAYTSTETTKDRQEGGKETHGTAGTRTAISKPQRPLFPRPPSDRTSTQVDRLHWNPAHGYHLLLS